MKNHGMGIVCLAFAAFAAVAAGTSTPAGFTDDLDAAMKRAQANGRKILTVFSGSDWCIWCKRLEAEILSKDRRGDPLRPHRGQAHPPVGRPWRVIRGAEFSNRAGR